MGGRKGITLLLVYHPTLECCAFRGSSGRVEVINSGGLQTSNFHNFTDVCAGYKV